MCIVVADCSVEFSINLGLFQSAHLQTQSVAEIGILFANGGRGGGLTVGMGKHREIGPFLADLHKAINQFIAFG